jgi:aerobic carbon-monoxide dehydrogenase large subunit
MGAYLSCFAPYIPYVGAVMLPGVYDFATCFIRITAAYTNTLPVDAYRGAGRPEASYVIERLVDVAARELDMGARRAAQAQLHQAEGHSVPHPDREDL